MKTLSELSMCSELAQQAFAGLLKMATGASIRTNTVMEGLGQRIGVSQLEVKEAVRELYRAKLLQYKPDRQELPATGLVTIVRPPRVIAAHEDAWSSALDASAMSDLAKEALRPLYLKLSDLPNEDMVVLAAALARLESSDGTVTADAGFNVSARAIMGGSKVLANLAPKMVQALGLPARLQTSSPRYVICAGPSDPVATVLIENPRAFENAVRSGLGESVALVCTYGFGLSYLGQAWADDAHEEDRPIQIVRAGTPPSLTALLQAVRVYLWADLDLAALSIFRSLQTAIPHLKLSGIYEAMMAMAQDQDTSHPYASLFEKDGQAVAIAATVNSVDPFVQAIMASCRERAVDQEAVPEQKIFELGRS